MNVIKVSNCQKMFVFLVASAYTQGIKLELTAEIEPIYASGKGGTKLTWTNISDQDIYYKLYQKSKESGD